MTLARRWTNILFTLEYNSSLGLYEGDEAGRYGHE